MEADNPQAAHRRQAKMEEAVKKGPGASDEQFAINILDFVSASVLRLH